MKVFAVLVAAGGLLLASVHSFAQQTGTAARVYSGADIQHQLANLVQAAQAKGSSGTTLAKTDSHALQLSVRTESGGAEVHSHFDDVMVVMGGSASLVTGGTVIDPKTYPNGEIKGSAIRDGVQQQLTSGDVVHVPAGTPHQLILEKGSKFEAFVVKVHEP